MALRLYYIFAKCKFESENNMSDCLKITCKDKVITSVLKISNFLSMTVSLDFFS